MTLALVTGTGRSGTTLVQETLARHEGVGFVSGLDDKLPRLNSLGKRNRQLYRLAGQRPSKMRALSETTQLLDPKRLRVAPSEGYNLLDLHVMNSFSTVCRDLLESDATPFYTKRLQEFFGSRIQAQECDVFLHHLTGWPRTGFIRAAFPDVKVIHVVRDGRAVANSWLQMGWWDGWQGPENWIYGPLPEDLQQEWVASDRSFVVLAAIGWKMLMRAYQEAERHAPEGTWLTVRHEDVLDTPRETFERMVEHLGLDWTPDFDAAFERHVIERHRRESWRDELSPAQLQALTECLAEDLPVWGYSAD